MTAASVAQPRSGLLSSAEHLSLLFRLPTSKASAALRGPSQLVEITRVEATAAFRTEYESLERQLALRHAKCYKTQE